MERLNIFADFRGDFPKAELPEGPPGAEVAALIAEGLARRRFAVGEVEVDRSKDAKVTVEEVAIEPGERVLPHRHTGPVFGYVLEGEYEHAINDDRVTIYKAGDTFYEPSGCVHRVTRNPSKTAKTRLLAVILHPRDAKEVTVPEKEKK
jgi:quercetin dioxygenase-like cupin family protein